MAKPTLFPTTAQGLPMDTPRLASAQARNSIFPQKTRRPLFPFLEQFGVDTPVAAPVESNITPQSLNASLDLNALKPKFQDVFLEDLVPRKPTAQELLAKALNDRAMAGREAVDLRRQQLREQGALGYEDVNDPAKAAEELENSMYMLRGVQGETNPFGDRFLREFMPLSNIAYDSGGDVESARLLDTPGLQSKALPGIGTALRTSDGKAAVVGRYGVGYATQRDTPDPNRKIEGIPAAEWFKQAAIRQGADNKFARAESTGKVDKLGRPILKAVGIPSGSDAATERVFEGMKSGKYNPAKGGWQTSV